MSGSRKRLQTWTDSIPSGKGSPFDTVDPLSCGSCLVLGNQFRSVLAQSWTSKFTISGGDVSDVGGTDIFEIMSNQTVINAASRATPDSCAATRAIINVKYYL